jgi:hypothetical protein
MADLDRILEMFDRVPKVIDPRTHAALDYFTAAAFFVAAGLLWKKPAAVATALINGGMVLGMSLLTDYDGDGRRPISFPTHGKLDIVQASLAMFLPTALRFGSEPEALFFRAQALNEGMVVALTDFQSSRREQEEAEPAAEIAG